MLVLELAGFRNLFHAFGVNARMHGLDGRSVDLLPTFEWGSFLIADKQLVRRDIGTKPLIA